MFQQLLPITSWIMFEGEDDAAAKAAAEAKAKADAEAENGDKQFTQEQLNTFLAEERRKMQEKQRKTVTELETLRKSSSLTVKEKEDLQKRIDDLQAQYLTTEEKTRRKEEAADKKRSEEIAVLTKERDSWEAKHSELMINTEITNEATANKAFQHEQIIAIIAPKTKLEEKLNEDGESTGKFEPRVSFPDKDKDDKPVILKLTISETLKRMKELDQYGNLFEGSKVGGLGGTGSQIKGKKVDLAKIAKEDPAAYRKLRKERIANE